MRKKGNCTLGWNETEYERYGGGNKDVRSEGN